MTRVVIVGGSVGGVRTAQALRTEGFAGEIVILESEQNWPYDKPPLSKALLAGDTESSSIELISREEAAQRDIEIRLGTTARAVRPGDREIDLDDGSLAYDHLVIATGAVARQSPWGTRAGIHVVRTLADAAALRVDLAAGGPVAVIGAGFIGAEVSATARVLGVDSILIDPLPTPMSRAFEPDVGSIFTDLHTRHGVRCLFGSGVRAIDGERGDFTVHLDDGSEISAGTVVVGIGAAPQEGWLLDSGLAVADGVVCDEYLRSVDDSAVHAVGDIARWRHPATGTLIRLEHWTNAVDQAVCVAHNISRPDDLRSYDPVEYVWTDQYDWKIQVVGHTTGAPYHQMLGEPETGRFAVAYADGDGLLLGAAVVNWPRALVASRKAMKAGGSLADLANSVRVGSDAKAVLA